MSVFEEKFLVYSASIINDKFPILFGKGRYLVVLLLIHDIVLYHGDLISGVGESRIAFAPS